VWVAREPSLVEALWQLAAKALLPKEAVRSSTVCSMVQIGAV
jgi:hypothetical protein